MARRTGGIGEMINGIAQQISQLELDDINLLGRIFARLEQVSEELAETRPAAATLAGHLCAAVEKVILDECGPVAQAMEVIGRGVEMLQRTQGAFEASGDDAVDDEALLATLSRLAEGAEATSEDGETPPEQAEAESPESEAVASEQAASPAQADAPDQTDMDKLFEEEEHAVPEASDEMALEDTEAGTPGVLDQLATEIMTLELDDLSALGNVMSQLENLAEASRTARPAYTDLVESLARVAQQIILDECGGMEDPLDIIVQGIAMLQRMQVAFDRGQPEATDDPDLMGQIASLCSADMPATDGAPDEADEEPVLAEAPDPTPEAEPPPAIPDEPKVDADIFQDFASEAAEHLGAAESTLLSLESNPEDGELLNTVFRSFHTIKGAAGFLNLREVTRVAHAVEDVLDSARKGKLKLNASILDVVLESIDLLRALLAGVQAKLQGETAEPRDISVFLTKVTAAISGEEKPVERATAPADKSEGPDIAPPASPVHENGKAGEGVRKDQLLVRVGTEKLDQLVNMVGELVITQTQVMQSREILMANNQKLTRDVAQLHRITRDLQEVAMAMRMVPIRGTFERMARMVRDLSRKCGKQVEFHMTGEDTELDKNVVEELIDPLTHMVRNAVDHGVESEAERKAAGKSEKGQVSLTACHQGGNIVIELRDDGKGLNREKILQKAVERGLVREGEEVIDSQIYDFIFHAGLSTAEKVSDVSGRGVGMDVVRRSIEKLRGKVEVFSQAGKGSSFTIRLPLTLAIIDGMVIGVGGERYVLPLTSIVRSLRPTKDQVFSVMNDGEMVNVLGDLYPLVRLGDRFGVAPKSHCPWESLVILIEAEGGACCLLVDELLGIQQVVIKGLDDDLRYDNSLSGCTILGDGHVGLILDANGLVHQANRRARGASFPVSA